MLVGVLLELRLCGVCSQVKLCGFDLMSLSGMHLLRNDTLQAEVKYTPYCITTEKFTEKFSTS